MKLNTQVSSMALLLGAFITSVGIAQLAHDKLPDSPALFSPKSLHVYGHVVDEDENPLPNVVLEHIDRSDEFQTDSSGAFEFDTSAPLFVAQKPGFESARIKNDGSGEIRVVLRKLPHGSQFPTCSNSELAASAPGWAGAFQVPKSGLKKAYSEGKDVDYGARSLLVKSDSGKLVAVQGRGPLWSLGRPSDKSVWESVQYSERTYDLDGILITDAKGWRANGRCWRSVAVLGESVRYDDVDCNLANPLDALLDSVCAVPDASKRLRQ